MSKTGINSLPLDVVLKIFDNVDLPDLANLHYACRAFHQVMDEEFWHKAFFRWYPVAAQHAIPRIHPTWRGEALGRMRVRADVLRPHGKHHLWHDYADTLENTASMTYGAQTHSLLLASASDKAMLFSESSYHGRAPIERLSLEPEITRHGAIALVQASSVGVIYCFQDGFIVLVSEDGARIVQTFGTMAVAGEMQDATFQAAAASENLLVTCVLVSFGSIHVRAWNIARGTCFGSWMIDPNAREVDQDVRDQFQTAPPFTITTRSSIMINGAQIAIFGFDSFVSRAEPSFHLMYIDSSTMLMKNHLLEDVFDEERSLVSEEEESRPENRYFLQHFYFDWRARNPGWPRLGVVSAPEIRSAGGQYIVDPVQFTNLDARSDMRDCALDQMLASVLDHKEPDRWFAVCSYKFHRAARLTIYTTALPDDPQARPIPLTKINLKALKYLRDYRYDGQILGMNRTLVFLKYTRDANRVLDKAERIVVFDVLSGEHLPCSLLKTGGLLTESSQELVNVSLPNDDSRCGLDPPWISRFMLHPFLAQGAIVFNSVQLSLLKLDRVGHHHLHGRRQERVSVVVRSETHPFCEEVHLVVRGQHTSMRLTIARRRGPPR